VLSVAGQTVTFVNVVASVDVGNCVVVTGHDEREVVSHGLRVLVDLGVLDLLCHGLVDVFHSVLGVDVCTGGIDVVKGLVFLVVGLFDHVFLVVTGHVLQVFFDGLGLLVVVEGLRGLVDHGLLLADLDLGLCDGHDRLVDPRFVVVIHDLVVTWVDLSVVLL